MTSVELLAKSAVGHEFAETGGESTLAYVLGLLLLVIIAFSIWQC